MTRSPLLGLHLVAFVFGTVPLCAGTASAQPVSWTRTKSALFAMYLPPGWRQLARKKVKKEKPWLGTWRYSSAAAGHKLFVRVIEDKPGALDKILAGSEPYLRKRAKGLKPMVPPSVVKDTTGRETAIALYGGTLNVYDRKTKKASPAAHDIVRAVQRFKRNKLLVIITYLAGGERRGEVGPFAHLHLKHFEIFDSPERLELAKRVALAKKPKRRGPPRAKAGAADAILEKPKVVAPSKAGGAGKKKSSP